MFNLDTILHFAIVNCSKGMYDELISSNRLTLSPRCTEGTILIVRKHRDPYETYGAMGFWFVHTHLGRWRSIVCPLIRFRTPYNEDIFRGNSRRVNGLTSRYLTPRFINMYKSGRSYDILKDYIRQIMGEKGEECILGRRQYEGFIDTRVVDEFMAHLVEESQNIKADDI